QVGTGEPEGGRKRRRSPPVGAERRVHHDLRTAPTAPAGDRHHLPGGPAELPPERHLIVGRDRSPPRRGLRVFFAHSCRPQAPTRAAYPRKTLLLWTIPQKEGVYRAKRTP